jgi:low affinity Fe/Cu permease
MNRLIEKWSVRIIEWVGSASSLVVHTVLFVILFGLKFFHFNMDQILLILTTVVSLEAIYLAIFNQMTLNRHTRSLQEVETDMKELQDDVDEILEEE